jgi:two-component system, NarL family, invasion response regulator UvrY
MKVLIIDDHAVVRRGMISLLQEHIKGVEVGEANEARSGLEAVRSDRWDLVIVDITMPGRNGLELIQDIRLEYASLPILVISSHPEKDYALRALKLGAAGYVSKQSAADILVTAVQRVLSGRRYISSALAEQLAGAIAGETSGTSHETLSNRELQVLRLIALGKTVKEISTELALSAKTVATYRSRIAEKMGLSSNVELTRYAMQHGLVD